jgi:chromosome segregation ATPase
MKVEDIILKGLDSLNLKVDNLNTAVASLQTETKNHGQQIEKLNNKFDKLPDCRYEKIEAKTSRIEAKTSKMIVDLEALKRNKNFDTSEIDALDKKQRKAFGKTIKTIVAIVLNAIAGFFAWRASR